MSTLPLEDIEAGLADTRIRGVVATLCDKCSFSFVATVIPLPPKRCLQSDYAPTVLELSQIHSDYQEEELQLREFNNEITRLHTVLGRLTEARNRLEERLFRRKAALYAVRKVPIEIWQMVFTWVGAERVYSFDLTDPEAAPMRSIPHTLSRVCKQWKRIVDSVPVLWSSMRIRFSKLQTDIRPLLTEHLEKSRTNPLRISFEEENPNFPHRGFPMHPYHQHLNPIQEQCFLHLMTRMAPRCEELEFCFPYDLREPPLNIKLPLLRSFRSDLLPHQHENTMWLWNNAQRASHLEHLSLYYLPEVPEIATERLLSLEFQDVPNGSSFLTLLQECHCLESLVVKDVHFDQNDSVVQNIDAIHLPHLQRMSLGTEEEPQTLAFFFDALDAPCLTAVQLEFNIIPEEMDDFDDEETGEVSFPQEAVIGMLKRHSPSLRQLGLTFHRDDEESVLVDFSWSGILQAVPELRRVSCFADFFHLDSNLAEVRTLLSSLQCPTSPSSSEGVLVPRLEEVFLRLGEGCKPDQGQSEALWKAMIEMAESRSNDRLSAEANITPLRALCVTWLGEEEGSVCGLSDGKNNWFPLDEALSGRLNALELSGTTCFFVDLQKYLAELRCEIGYLGML
ncbi:hypothetical protein E1B28_009794 [Marasmius oreades]|uniref:F-box domain-containing protein n=1 Tax=Marasmius oreades TaxID=181124 RepID=A0A9P7RWJ6_9AGAR|nr:uncharacterized protein E1B28_009794 [Marasmius oreades]KAG7090700.1 hypothetical protein E1B28_009794 [Marasmius oreades]